MKQTEEKLVKLDLLCLVAHNEMYERLIHARVDIRNKWNRHALLVT